MTAKREFSDLELLAKEVCEIRAHLDFYAAWVPLVQCRGDKSEHCCRHGSPTVKRALLALDKAIDELSAEVADRFSE